MAWKIYEVIFTRQYKLQQIILKDLLYWTIQIYKVNLTQAVVCKFYYKAQIKPSNSIFGFVVKFMF